MYNCKYCELLLTNPLLALTRCLPVGLFWEGKCKKSFSSWFRSKSNKTLVTWFQIRWIILLTQHNVWLLTTQPAQSALMLRPRLSSGTEVSGSGSDSDRAADLFTPSQHTSNKYIVTCLAALCSFLHEIPFNSQTLRQVKSQHEDHEQKDDHCAFPNIVGVSSDSDVLWMLCWWELGLSGVKLPLLSGIITSLHCTA